MPKASFRIDPRLASLLGEGYRSTEQALKELIDNAWDADASKVTITLPASMSQDPVVIEDNGTGMTDAELRGLYLRIAHDRRRRQGESTPIGRRIKGRKGIGKFAGLVVANEMSLQTRARGKCTKLMITKQHLYDSDCDLEQVDLPISSEDCDKGDHGTTITLSRLSDKFTFPNADALKALLAIDYGRQQGFHITVNNDPVTHEDIPGHAYEEEARLPDAGKVKYHFKIREGTKTVKQPGIALRVQGKIVGKPSFFGLEEDETVPPKLLKRIVGEIEADDLEGEVTADWSSLIENGKGRNEVRQMIQSKVK